MHSGGSCRALRGLLQPGQGWDFFRVPVHCFVLEHPTRGRLLFDTGYAPRLLSMAWAYCWLLDVRPAPAPVPQVQVVILSHFHPDHIAGCRDYPTATFLYSRWAWQQAQGRPGYLPALLPADFSERAHPIESRPEEALPSWLAPYERGRDLFGDGSLWAVDLPGHAAGQFGLAGESQRGRFFLIADACFTGWEIEQRRPPNRWLLRAAGADPRAYQQTLNQLHELRSRNPELLMWPCHCVSVPTIPPTDAPGR